MREPGPRDLAFFMKDWHVIICLFMIELSAIKNNARRDRNEKKIITSNCSAFIH